MRQRRETERDFPRHGSQKKDPCIRDEMSCQAMQMEGNTGKFYRGKFVTPMMTSLLHHHDVTTRHHEITAMTCNDIITQIKYIHT